MRRRIVSKLTQLTLRQRPAEQAGREFGLGLGLRLP
jgi:hypothetical protein